MSIQFDSTKSDLRRDGGRVPEKNNVLNLQTLPLWPCRIASNMQSKDF